MARIKTRFSAIALLLAGVASATAASGLANGIEAAHWAEPTETTPSIQTRIVGGTQSTDSQFPFAVALRTRLYASLAMNELRGSAFLLSGSTITSGSGQVVQCGFYPDMNAACRDGQVQGGICLITLDYTRTGGLGETPNRQLERCEQVGGVGAVFFESINGSFDVLNVRGTVARIPAIYGGPEMGVFAQSLITSGGATFSITPELLNTVYCGGSYLGDRWVATAAHCVANSDGSVIHLPGEIAATVGVSDLASAEAARETVTVEQIEFNPAFRINTTGQPKGDWALLRLSSEPVSGEAIRIASDARLDSAKSRGDAVTVIGWGSQSSRAPGADPGVQLVTPNLQHATINLVDTATCNAGLERFNTDFQGGDRSELAIVDDEEVCHADTASFTRNVCNGDSGGPSVITVGDELKLVGATSWGLECGSGTQDVYAVSTSLSHFNPQLSAITGFDVLSTARALPSNGTVTPAGGSSSGGGSMSIMVLLWLLSARRRRKDQQPSNAC